MLEFSRAAKLNCFATPHFARGQIFVSMRPVRSKPAAPTASPVTNPSRWSRYGWVLLAVLACLLAGWAHALRIKRVQFVSAIGEASAAAAGAESTAPWQPKLIVPQHDNTSFEWLAQTREMFNRHEWRIRRVDYENAPIGHELEGTSPYRWWLGLLAWVDHSLSGRSAGESIERVALFADPLLELVLLVAAVGVIAWQFGRTAAAWTAIALISFFPLGLSFLPGAPGAVALGQFWVFWSVLPLLIGVRRLNEPSLDSARSANRWFCLGGIAGGLGMWVDVTVQWPVAIGVMIGAILAAWIGRNEANTNASASSPPWRVWAISGSLTIAIAYFAEYYPALPDNGHLRTIHPLYGLAWMGLGLIAAAGSSWMGATEANRTGRRLRQAFTLLIGLVALAALPWWMWRKHTWGFLDVEVSAFRLSRVAADTPATSWLAWSLRDGMTPRLAATLLPLALIAPAGWWLLFRNGPVVLRRTLALALGPLLVAVGFAGKQLSWWSTVDVLAIVLLVPVVALFVSLRLGRMVRWSYAAALAALCGIGFVQVFPDAQARGEAPVESADTLTLVERDLARWLSLHVGPHGGVVLAPHNQAITLYYYGGLRGLATLSKENAEGLGAAVRIMSASTPEEAKELIEGRGVTHLVIPSWDSYLETYARMGMGKVEGTFFERLSLWRLPPWLKPVPYQLPVISGFEGNSVTLFEVVEDQDDASSLSRVAEYFLEMQQLDRAANVAQTLRRFPADLGALTARAQVDYVRDDQESFKRTLESIQRRIASGSDRAMAWDRRVSLAVVLAEAKLTELARERVKRCVTEATEPRIRSLTTGQLYRLLVLARAYGCEFTEPALTELALSLVPDEVRAKVEPRSNGS